MLLALVRRAELVALEVLELGTGRKLFAVIRHDDPILFRRLPRLGSARATHMGGVDRPVGARGFGDPLNRAARLRRLVPFCRHDKCGFAVTAEVRAGCPRSPEPFRHGEVANRICERGARNERRSKSDDGAHGVARTVSNLQLYPRRHAMFQPGMPAEACQFLSDNGCGRLRPATTARSPPFPERPSTSQSRPQYGL